MDRLSSLLDHILSFLPTKYAALTPVLSKRWLNLWKLVPNLDIDDSVFLHPEEGKGERVLARQEMMDRVSNLPDEVLCHILSFLTTKEAALTLVLAKRWHNLFASVPKLAIDDSVFLHPEKGKHDREDIIESFMSFVDRVLALQGNSPVKEVFIKCQSKLDSDRVDSWIHNVLERGVSDLDLRILPDSDDEDSDEDDRCLRCSTLVKLKMSFGTDMVWLTGSIFLPMLKTLVLGSIKVYSADFELLLHALPLLEELVLAYIYLNDFDVTVSSASLKKLTLHNDSELNTFSFDTPRLVYFKYCSCLALDYHVVNMKNLRDARIIFDVEMGRARNHVEYTSVWKLFHGIQNVQSLYLSPSTLVVLSACESMPVFNNLKSLDIRSDEEHGWQAMPILLLNCPQLESLSIEGLIHYVTDQCGDACDCISRKDKGRSLTLCPVKVLEIRGFQGTIEEMRMIKHFLDYFPCLKRFNVFIEENDPTQLRNPVLLIKEVFNLYNELSSCKVNLRLSDDDLDKKWTEQGHI